MRKAGVEMPKEPESLLRSKKEEFANIIEVSEAYMGIYE